MTASLTSLTFKEPLLQIRLKQDSLPVWLIGIVFSMDTITFTLTSIALNCVHESKKNFAKIVSAGVFLFCISLMLSGPCPGLFPDKIIIIAVGILIGGIGGACINNNVIPNINQQAQLLNVQDQNQLKNIIASINTGAFGFGSILGPILASVLQSTVGYRYAFVVVAALVLLVAFGQLYSAYFYKVKNP